MRGEYPLAATFAMFPILSAVSASRNAVDASIKVDQGGVGRGRVFLRVGTVEGRPGLAIGLECTNGRRGYGWISEY